MRHGIYSRPLMPSKDIPSNSGCDQRLEWKRAVLDLFSPLPSWVTKRWDLVGEPVLSTGCLFSYAFPEATVATEIKFLSDYLWLVQKS